MKKIFVIDDDVTTRSLLKMLLEMEGYQIFVPGPDLDELYHLIQSESPVLLFIDIHLQTISGIDILNNLRSHPDYATLKILMTSGMDLADKCHAAGADGFLLKPFMPDELISWIKDNT